MSPLNPGWELHCYGDGDLRSDAQELIHAYGLSSSTKLFAPVKETSTLFKEVSLLVLPSKTEQSPMVILEAMNAGTPCIAYNCPAGVSEVICDGVNGRIVPDQDLVKFSGILSEVLNNSSVLDEMGSMAKVRVREFSEQRVMMIWSDLYQGLVR